MGFVPAIQWTIRHFCSAPELFLTYQQYNLLRRQSYNWWRPEAKCEGRLHLSCCQDMVGNDRCLKNNHNNTAWVANLNAIWLNIIITFASPWVHPDGWVTRHPQLVAKVLLHCAINLSQKVGNFGKCKTTFTVMLTITKASPWQHVQMVETG